MPDPTTNRGYNRPDEGTENWNHPLNENFESIDTDLGTANQRLNDLEDRIAGLENTGDGYYTGTSYFLSDYADWRDWVDAATDGNGDILVVDESRSGLSGAKTIPEKTKVTTDNTSNIYTLTKADSSGRANLLRPHNDNVMIDGKLDDNGNRRLVIDGNRANNPNPGGGGLIGSTYWPSVSHFRLLNTKIINAPRNGFMLDPSDNPDQTYDDILIKNCWFENNDAHDIFASSRPADNPDSSEPDKRTVLSNILIIGNVFHFYGDQICCTTAGEDGEGYEDPPADEHNHSHAIIGNTIIAEGDNTNGSLLAFEELVRNCVAYGNLVDGTNNSSGAHGIVVSKDVDNCVVFRNETHDCNDGILIWTPDDYYNNGGNPSSVIVSRNYSHDNYDAGLGSYNTDGEITITDNHAENNGGFATVEQEGGTGGDEEVANNGIGVEGGIPGTLATSISYTSPGGDTFTASWDEGATDPNDGRVSVSVSVTT